MARPGPAARLRLNRNAAGITTPGYDRHNMVLCAGFWLIRRGRAGLAGGGDSSPMMRLGTQAADGQPASCARDRFGRNRTGQGAEDRSERIWVGPRQTTDTAAGRIALPDSGRAPATITRCPLAGRRPHLICPTQMIAKMGLLSCSRSAIKLQNDSREAARYGKHVHPKHSRRCL